MYRYWYQIIEAQKILLAVLATAVKLQFCLLFSLQHIFLVISVCLFLKIQINEKLITRTIESTK